MPTIKELQDSVNILEFLDDSTKSEIAHSVLEGYELDENSRIEWKDTVDKAMAIAKQTHEVKNTPWPNASNIKYPLITRASIDYAARTMPEIIQGKTLIKTNSPGLKNLDKTNARGKRVSDFMAWQLLVDSPDWEEGTDKLLQILPILGTVFKKTYYNSIDKRICSEVCVPDKIVVNYSTPSLEKAQRITHIITMSQNDVRERQLRGTFEDVDIDSLRPSTSATDDRDFYVDILEQHCYLDLDGDGYKEPYVVFLHKDSMQLLRIVQRFKKVEKDNKGEVIKIDPEQYFTDFHFIPSPDGGFYSMGFGSLLLPLNATINSIYNMLLDAGTLANTQSGFIGRGLRIRNGEFKFPMGSWQVLDASSGTDIAKNIFQLPVREPSAVLFKLLTLTIQIGADLTSATDPMKGDQAMQNVASSAYAQAIEQGTKIFTAINKRVFRSQGKEYKKIYDLNYRYIPQKLYVTVLDDEEADIKSDFESASLDIYPIADPTMSSDTQRLQRASVVSQLRTADPRAADTMIMQALHFDEAQIKAVLPPPNPDAPPPPEAQKMMMEAQKLQVEAQAIMAQLQLDQQKLQLQIMTAQQQAEESKARINEGMGRVWKMQKDALHGDQKVQIAANKMQQQELYRQADLVGKQDKQQAELMLKVNDQANDLAKHKDDTEINKLKISADLLKVNNNNAKQEQSDSSDDDQP